MIPARHLSWLWDAKPTLRQFGQYECECGELHGIDSAHTAWRG
jgi:hypothetical protein